LRKPHFGAALSTPSVFTQRGEIKGKHVKGEF